jgi:predicted nuclease of restriction endonuclease-like (RecB) superfamily
MLPIEQFEEVAQLIRQAKTKALFEVNKTLIQLYQAIGSYIAQKIERQEWGTNVVEALAKYLESHLGDAAGFSARNLWRMKQFYETYKNNPILSPLVTELNWSNNLLILSGTKTTEEKEFYLRLSIQEKYSKRELERQLNSGLYERVALSQKAQFPHLFSGKDLKMHGFRDNYVLDFLQLPDTFSETDLRRSILKSLKSFVLETSKDFTFMGDEYRIEVGKDDFYIDLLFFHRELCCLVAIELKIGRFKPEYVGKMDFYLESLDRTLKKPHENPSVGIILRKEKEDEIVEIALSRTLSPTLVATYQTKLIDKKRLQEKLHEFYELLQSNPKIKS